MLKKVKGLKGTKLEDLNSYAVVEKLPLAKKDSELQLKKILQSLI